MIPTKRTPSNQIQMPLSVIATPIGNLEDLSPRALKHLKQAEIILAEDTRKTQALLASHKITAKLRRCDSYEEERLVASDKFLREMKSGAEIALVSDAGSPTISDPGAKIVALAHEHKVPVVVVPGPSALIAALSVSGFGGSKFYFGGYLPAAENNRRKVIQQYASAPLEVLDSKTNLVFYETPHRIKGALDDLCEIWGEGRRALLARELTKEHETLYRGTLTEIRDSISEQELKGEIVIVLENAAASGDDTKAGGGKATKSGSAELTEADKSVLKLLLEDLNLKEAAAIAAKLTNKSKNLFYEQGLKFKDEKK